MRSAADIPIRLKLLLLGLLASSTALGLACGLFIAIERDSLRDQIVRKLQVQAEMIALNSAPALVFQDPDAASQTLAALRADRHVASALIVTPDGTPFASFRRSGDDELPRSLEAAPGISHHEFSPRAVVLSHGISVEGRPAGAVLIRSDLGEIDERTRQIVGLGVLVFLLSLLLALGVSGALARSLSRPVLNLADLARRVSEEKDYSLRAPAGGRDEVGRLVASVNMMLAEIETRDETLEAQRAELERSNADLEQFAYVTSHDLQEPLRMVSVYAQLLQEEYGNQLDDDAKEYIHFAVDGTHRMHALIQDLLAYSRVGMKPVETQHVDVQKLLEEIRHDLSGSMADAGAELTTGDLPVVDAEPAQLRQVFQNLVSNAIKFRGEQAPRVHVSATRRPEGGWLFQVQDNGIGIEARHAEKIFVIFQRLHARERYPGTGIGLAICKKIVERHGGRIWMESTPGRGTTFNFTWR